MDVNDDAGCLDKHSALTSIASGLAPTGIGVIRSIKGNSRHE